MASGLTVQKFGAKNVTRSYRHNPGDTASQILSPDGGTTLRSMDGQGLTEFRARFNQSIATGGATLCEIVAATDAAMTGDVTQIKTSGAVVMDAVDDEVQLECTMEEVAERGANAGVKLRYLSARMTCANSADELVVFLDGIGKRQRDGLSGNNIS